MKYFYVLQSKTTSRAYRRRGFAMIYIALTIPVLMGAAAIAFDLSHLYNRKAEAQKTADAAALAGAVNGLDGTAEKPGARRIAAANGYDYTNGATVVARTEPGKEGWYRATVSRPERLFFAAFFGGNVSNVGATAVAEYLAEAEVPMQNYGIENGPINLSLFGPNAFRYNGDPYSPLLLSDGSTNTEHKSGGYDFNIKLRDRSTWKSRYSTDFVEVEIFDPGTGNAGGANSPFPGVAIDEIRSGHSGKNITDTRYELYFDNNTPGDSSDDVLVDSRTFNDGDQGLDMQWDKTFKFSVDDPRWSGKGGNFRLNVKTIDGSSENGFELRAGPLHTLTDSQQWKDQYGPDAVGGSGADVSARGSIPINFNAGGPVTLMLGQVPPLPLGGQVIIEKFDTDVGSQSVQYTDGTDTYNGILSTNDQSATDTYILPPGYAGGLWKANYTAGSQDTSLWRMRYTGIGNLRLIR